LSEEENNTLIRYKSDWRIDEYFKNRSKLDKILKEKDRSKFSVEEKNFDNKLRQDKKRLLDNVIFPSMTNLLIFFEHIKENEELLDLFEEDIKELFGFGGGIRRNSDIIGGLIDSILTWNMEKYPDNFRLGLITQIQQTIFDKFVINISGSIIDKEKQTILSQTIENDMRRALSWTQFLSSTKFDNKTKNK
jgi:hypothetical protein